MYYENSFYGPPQQLWTSVRFRIKTETCRRRNVSYLFFYHSPSPIYFRHVSLKRTEFEISDHQNYTTTGDRKSNEPTDGLNILKYMSFENHRTDASDIIHLIPIIRRNKRARGSKSNVGGNKFISVIRVTRDERNGC